MTHKEIQARNLEIRKTYTALREQKISQMACVEKIQEKYSGLSGSQIHNICVQRRLIALIPIKNKTYTKILVQEKNGRYGDWTGVFRLKRDETIEQLTDRTLKFFRENFLTSGEYTDKKFALRLVEKQNVKTFPI